MGSSSSAGRDYCTYFDRNYLTRGVAMINSLNKWETEPHTIIVVCMDELTRVILEKLALPNVVTVPMHDIEAGDSALLATKENRSVREYLWTTTPTVILRVLERHSNGESLTYVDSDMLFYSSVEPIFTELAENNVIIHEHRFPPRLKHLEENGIYNVGLLSFRNTSEAREVLHWWRERCIEWCYDTPQDGKMGDQAYLNEWPTKFSKVGVIQNIGIGAAPWNIEQYQVSQQSNERVFLNDIELVLYHFHSLKFVNPLLIIPCAEMAYFFPSNYLRFIAIPYVESLLQAHAEVEAQHADFTCGLINNEILHTEHTFIAHKQLASEIAQSGIPQKHTELNDNWLCYYSNQVEEVAKTGSFR